MPGRSSATSRIPRSSAAARARAGSGGDHRGSRGTREPRARSGRRTPRTPRSRPDARRTRPSIRGPRVAVPVVTQGASTNPIHPNRDRGPECDRVPPVPVPGGAAARLIAPLRGCSSGGRALPWHGRGQGFESPQLHGSSSQARANSRSTRPGRSPVFSPCSVTTSPLTIVAA